MGKRRAGASCGEREGLGDTTTVHPYTFIPLKERRSFVKANRVELLTGFLECELTAKTPIAIPDFPNKDGSYPFYRVGGVPVIPGSSLRGAVRSIYEILTDSCMRTSEAHFHRRSGTPKNPGLLLCVDGEYRLFEAKRFRVDDKSSSVISNLSIGQEVAFSSRLAKGCSADWASVGEEGSEKGYFLRANRFQSRGGRSHPSIFKKVSGNFMVVDQLSVGCLEENIALYDLSQSVDGKGLQGEIGRAYGEAFEKMKHGGFYLPVWYEKIDDCYRFAPSQISRDVYPLGPRDFLARKKLSPCSSLDDCCPACSLFGFVAGDVARASKLRFTDACCVGGIDMKYGQLPALMEPKMSSFEFYLRNDNNTHSFAPDDDETELSGRKLYWHSQKGLDGVKALDSRDDLGSVVEMAPEGSRFSFRINFDDISADQLNNLVYALSIGDEWLEASGKNMSQHCLKIGRGKPVGLGSVSVRVKKVLVRTFAVESYALDDGFDWQQPLGNVEGRLSENVGVLKKVTAFDAVPSEKTIAYPNIGGNALAWYGENRLVGGSYREVLEVDGRYGYRKEDMTRVVAETFGGEDFKSKIDSRLAPLESLLKKMQEGV